MITATLIGGHDIEREDLEQRLYQLSEPILFGWTEDETEYVIVSGLAVGIRHRTTRDIHLPRQCGW